MNIMENKRVAAIALAMAVAFGGICYLGYDRYSALKTSQSKIDEIEAKLEAYASESIPPRVKNRDLITQTAKEAKSLYEGMYADLLQYASFCIAGQGAQSSPAAHGDSSPKSGYMPVAEPTKFQDNLKSLIASLGQYADKKKCSLGGPNQTGAEVAPVDKFGNYSHFQTTVPQAQDVPYYNFLLYAADAAVRHIADSGAPAIRKIYFRDLPPAEARKDKYLPLSFEVAFSAKRSDCINPADPGSMSVLPQVINKLTHDKRFFFIPTGVAVSTRGNLPPANPALLPGAAAEDDDANDDEAEAAASEPEMIAAPIVGRDEDTVDVYLTLQVLYFTSDKF